MKIIDHFLTFLSWWLGAPLLEAIRESLSATTVLLSSPHCFLPPPRNNIFLKCVTPGIGGAYIYKMRIEEKASKYQVRSQPRICFSPAYV